MNWSEFLEAWVGHAAVRGIREVYDKFEQEREGQPPVGYPTTPHELVVCMRATIAAKEARQ